jgi:phosphatidylserine decarboxylase
MYLNIIIIVSLLVLLFIKYFYRFPYDIFYLKQSLREDKVYSPAYGKIIKINKTDDNIHIAIFLSPFDIHYQFAPINGIVKKITYDPSGKFNLAYELDKSNKNEKAIYTISNNKGEFIIYQISGFLTRDIHIFVKENQEIKTGVVLGLIDFGSRVDIIIPIKNQKFELLVKEDDKVQGIHSVLGKYIN